MTDRINTMTENNNMEEKINSIYIHWDEKIGSDLTGDGSPEKPFCTPEAARKKASGVDRLACAKGFQLEN